MTPNDLQNTASEALDTAAASSHEAADKTLRAASEALSQASARLNAARARAGETIDQWTERAQELARNGLDKASDTLDRSKRGLRRAGDATSAVAGAGDAGDAEGGGHGPGEGALVAVEDAEGVEDRRGEGLQDAGLALTRSGRPEDRRAEDRLDFNDHLAGVRLTGVDRGLVPDDAVRHRGVLGLGDGGEASDGENSESASLHFYFLLTRKIDGGKPFPVERCEHSARRLADTLWEGATTFPGCKEKDDFFFCNDHDACGL